MALGWAGSGSFMSGSSQPSGITAPKLDTSAASKLLDEIIQRYRPGGEFGKAELALLGRAKKKSLAETAQGLVSAGLSGTTAGVGAGKKWEEEIGMPAKLKLEDIRSGRLSEALGAKAGFLGKMALAQQQVDLQYTELQKRYEQSIVGRVEPSGVSSPFSRGGTARGGTVVSGGDAGAGDAGGYGSSYGGTGTGYTGGQAGTGGVYGGELDPGMVMSGGKLIQAGAPAGKMAGWEGEYKEYPYYTHQLGGGQTEERISPFARRL